MKEPSKFLPLIFLIGANIAFTACGRLAPKDQNVNLPQNTNLAIVRENPLTPAPSPIIVIEKTPEPLPAPPQSLDPNSTALLIDKLIIPVEGIKSGELQDTFKDARSEGRVHDAIDIMAPMGRPVLAAADGEIARFFESVKGGITIYQYSRNKRLIYYYAHLQRRADGLQEHQYVKQGTLIGYVGDTGNAGPGNTHLHFAVWQITDPKRYWDGANINPYVLLH
ncbi:MAG: M23 family metallopeptidase [Pyrinomonadaceae bacterium]